MDETQVLTYLRATGGVPTASAAWRRHLLRRSRALPTVPSATAQQSINYIEVMYRRGYTKGCGTTSDARRKYCPSDLLTRGQMAVFLIRAKMNNVFPTSLSGIPLAVNAGPRAAPSAAAAYGDNFGLFPPATVVLLRISAPSRILHLHPEDA